MYFSLKFMIGFLFAELLQIFIYFVEFFLLVLKIQNEKRIKHGENTEEYHIFTEKYFCLFKNDHTYFKHAKLNMHR